jgi:hypothetical protein
MMKVIGVGLFLLALFPPIRLYERGRVEFRYLLGGEAAVGEVALGHMVALAIAWICGVWIIEGLRKTALSKEWGREWNSGLKQFTGKLIKPGVVVILLVLAAWPFGAGYAFLIHSQTPKGAKEPFVVPSDLLLDLYLSDFPTAMKVVDQSARSAIESHLSAVDMVGMDVGDAKKRLVSELYLVMKYNSRGQDALDKLAQDKGLSGITWNDLYDKLSHELMQRTSGARDRLLDGSLP